MDDNIMKMLQARNENAAPSGQGGQTPLARAQQPAQGTFPSAQYPSNPSRAMQPPSQSSAALTVTESSSTAARSPLGQGSDEQSFDQLVAEYFRLRPEAGNLVGDAPFFTEMHMQQARVDFMLRGDDPAVQQTLKAMIEYLKQYINSGGGTGWAHRLTVASMDPSGGRW